MSKEIETSLNYQECLSKCREFGFNEDITRETLWNEAYSLGRRRWYWGPSWFVSLTGRFNTWRQKIGLGVLIILGVSTTSCVPDDAKTRQLQLLQLQAAALAASADALDEAKRKHYTNQYGGLWISADAVTIGEPVIATDLSLQLVTNWTGHVSGTNELGYVATNHIAIVRYDGATNEFKLKQVPSNIAVWRERAMPGCATNSIYVHPLILTNIAW